MHNLETTKQKIQRIKDKHKNLRRFFFNYSFAVFIGVGGLLIGIPVTYLFGNNTYFIFLLTVIAISAWSGNIKTGLLTLFITLIGIDLLFFASPPHLVLPTTLETAKLFLFILAGFIICICIEKSKNLEKVTEYKKREKEYVELILELQTKMTKAEKEITARDEFLSLASHELKTPLTSMLLQLQGALHNIRSVSLANFSVENLVKMLDNVEKQSKRLTKMINDLLNVSLITTGKINLEKEMTDLTALTRSVVEQFEERVKNEKIQLDFFGDKQVMGMMDKLRIEQVVINLLTNAIRYGEKKPIEVKVQKHGHNGIITVKDCGMGISSDLKERIFERFKRGNINPGIKGLGVGLYITNQIVKAHSGQVHVNSEVGKGTTFLVEIPLEK